MFHEKYCYSLVHMHEIMFTSASSTDGASWSSSGILRFVFTLLLGVPLFHLSSSRCTGCSFRELHRAAHCPNMLSHKTHRHTAIPLFIWRRTIHQFTALKLGSTSRFTPLS